MTLTSPKVSRFRLLALAFVVVAPMMALVPVWRIAADWVQLASVVEQTTPSSAPAVRGFDWVLWQEDDGVITADYVFPNGPAATAGLQEDDVFYMLEDQQFFNAEDLMRAVEGIRPGTDRTYYVLRDGEFLATTVRIKQYPTFLYPLSAPLWNFSLWSFTLGAFLHVLALIIVGPLALRSRAAAFSLLLIAGSALWMFANLLRLVAIEVFGPPGTAPTYENVFRALTVVGLVGWIGFPALLLRKVLGDAGVLDAAPLRHGHLVVYLPPLLIGVGALLTAVVPGSVPVPLDGLIGPLLFYVCCYVGTASALVLILYHLHPNVAERQMGGWSRAGSAVVLIVALLAGLSVLGFVPILNAVTDTTAGWLVVFVQLLTLAPVALVSVATLRHGKVNLVLSRALSYLTVLGLIFFAFVGGLALIEPYVARQGLSFNVVAGLYVVFLLFVFERLARPLRAYTARFFATDQQRKHQAMSRFQERMRNILDVDSLAQATVNTVGEVFDARSAVLYLRPRRDEDTWLASTYHPEPPFFTEHLLTNIWPHMRHEGRIWASNPELNESTLPRSLDRLMEQRRAALAVPVLGEDAPIGLLVLGTRRKHRTVYNLEDLDLLRSLASQLALAVERLHLVEREKALVRETAEAQLVALRAQINPHFLFNALNTIVALIEERPEEAEATVERLAAIFRHTLQTGSQPFVSLAEEMRLVDHYLHIEQARFGDKLEVRRAVDPELHRFPVPAFAVQTLVENAVKHGIERQRHGGRLIVDVRRGGPGIEITVTDTGAGIETLFDESETAGEDSAFFGIGLRNVSARLRQLYERDDLLRIASSPDSGTTARLLLPTYVPDTSPPGNNTGRRPVAHGPPDRERISA